ncbi:Uncharacterised protein [Candidatus Venteria ishoeyi]|uniref:Uncharacterized protein n=1 Tax=Candidatus Venteria ishoeyi TaxID=1899563 RepID=A0A1H6FHZ6_9GAMM|nr:Uncharacterised protein [Candidatus Venteria ishoeyi]
MICRAIFINSVFSVIERSRTAITALFRRIRQKSKSLSATHEANAQGTVLEVVTDNTIVEIHVPCAVRNVGIRRRRPKTRRGRSRKYCLINRWLITLIFHNRSQFPLSRQPPVGIALIRLTIGNLCLRQSLIPGIFPSHALLTVFPALTPATAIPHQFRALMADCAILMQAEFRCRRGGRNLRQAGLRSVKQRRKQQAA